MKQPINIELHTVIEDGEEEETTTITATGELIRNKGIDMAIYEENSEEQGKVKNTITIQPDKVSVKRMGTIKMNQLFKAGERSENIYHHPHGRIHMETYTDSIDYEPVTQEKTGHLSITYHVSLNGQEPRKHNLALILKL